MAQQFLGMPLAATLGGRSLTSQRGHPDRSGAALVFFVDANQMRAWEKFTAAARGRGTAADVELNWAPPVPDAIEAAWTHERAVDDASRPESMLPPHDPAVLAAAIDASTLDADTVRVIHAHETVTRTLRAMGLQHSRMDTCTVPAAGPAGGRGMRLTYYWEVERGGVSLRALTALATRYDFIAWVRIDIALVRAPATHEVVQQDWRLTVDVRYASA